MAPLRRPGLLDGYPDASMNDALPLDAMVLNLVPLRRAPWLLVVSESGIKDWALLAGIVAPAPVTRSLGAQRRDAALGRERSLR